MVKLRLQRHGSHKKPFYRIVATQSTSPRDGSFIEVIGTYNAIANPAQVTIDEAKALKWLQNGAQPTETVKSLLKKQGILEAFRNTKNN